MHILNTSILILLLCSCQSHHHQIIKEQSKNNPESWRKKYRDDLYIIAYIREASSLKDAENQAKIEIAQSIKSELKSKIQNTQKQSISNQNIQNSSEISIDLSITTDFKYAELIKIEPESKQCIQNQCTAFAYLHRNTLAEKLFIPLSPIHLRIEKQIQQLTQENISNQDFASHDRRFQQDFLQWYPKAFEIHLISPSYLKNYAEIIQKKEEIEKRKIYILNQYQIDLIPNQINEPKIAKAMVNATKIILDQLNLKYKESTHCTDDYAIQIEGKMKLDEKSNMMRKKKLSIDHAQIHLIKCPKQIIQTIHLPEIFAYESYNQSLENHLLDRIENQIFNEKNKNHQINEFVSKFKILLKDTIPLFQ